MFKVFAFIMLAGLSACAADETIARFVDPNAEFHLIELDGRAFDATATIQFSAAGEVVGQTPCNRYFAQQSLPYPWIKIDGIGATRMACPDLPLETAFLLALGKMTLAEAVGTTLILSNDAGRKMVFEAR